MSSFRSDIANFKHRALLVKNNLLFLLFVSCKMNK